MGFIRRLTLGLRGGPLGLDGTDVRRNRWRFSCATDIVGIFSTILLEVRAYMSPVTLIPPQTRFEVLGSDLVAEMNPNPDHRILTRY